MLRPQAVLEAVLRAEQDQDPAVPEAILQEQAQAQPQAKIRSALRKIRAFRRKMVVQKTT